MRARPRHRVRFVDTDGSRFCSSPALAVRQATIAPLMTMQLVAPTFRAASTDVA